MTGNVVGLSLAATSVVASGMQQILCRSLQLKHNLASHELLANVAPAQVGLPGCPCWDPGTCCPGIVRLGHGDCKRGIGS